MRTEKWPVTVSFHEELYGVVESMAAKEQRKLAAMVKILVAEAIAARSNADVTYRSNVDEKVQIEKAR